MSDQAVHHSRKLFESGFYCAESVLLAIAESQGIQSDLIPRIATGFCSGVARTSGQCGAVSGAIMALGLLKGRQESDAPVDPIYQDVQAFLAQFEESFGTLNCRELCGCDLNTPEGQQQFRDTGQFSRCAGYVEEATRIVLSLAEK